jgi:hypothetical protein
VLPVEGESDPLVANGLGSPLCHGGLSGEALPPPVLRHCETSGFAASAVPTGNYSLDVHIEAGFLGLGGGALLSAIQDLFVVPIWTAVVWSVHTMVSLAELGFTLDLLEGPALGALGRTLLAMQRRLTWPLMGAALAVAAVIAAHGGIVRRRITQTTGELVAMAVMIAAGSWAIADPVGTVGSLSALSDKAAVGLFSLPTSGSGRSTGATLADNLADLFAAAIEGPWCYLEFGAVDWCRDPARLDPRLRRAALAIAAAADGAACGGGAHRGCTGPASTRARSARLLREARTNGLLFLALPANGPDRNSISAPGSLLHTLCQSYEATSCSGPTASQAEFRTDAGTWPRVAGVLLIAAGVLGMLVVVGSIVARLLTAGVVCLLLLLLAPALVLFPALGERGRAVFARWALELFGTVVAKVSCSFLLGVLLAVSGVLQQLDGLGWWTQWLLSAAFWWSAFARRRALLGLAGLAGGRQRGAGHRPLRVVRDALDLRRAASSAWERRENWPPPQADEPAGLPTSPPLPSEPAVPEPDRAAATLLERDQRDARGHLRADGPVAAALEQGREQLQRIDDALAAAHREGRGRRIAELVHRRRRVQASIAATEGALASARATAGAEARSSRGDGWGWRSEQLDERADFLDEQASLSPRAREHAALAILAGHHREEYERLSPSQQLAVRATVDRELAARPAPPFGEREPEQPPAGDGLDGLPRGVPDPMESPVMRDIWAVIEGRKKLIGFSNL